MFAFFIMEYYVYAIASLERNYIYKGLTSDVIKRFHRHNNGFERTTKPYRPFILIYSESCTDRLVARKREKYFKSLAGNEKLKAIREMILTYYR